MGVADDLVSHRTSQQLVDGHVQRLALDVPQGDVDGAYGTGIDLVRWKEAAPEHMLPQPLGAERVLPDDDLREVLDGLADGRTPVADAHFAETVEAFVRLDLYDEILAAVAVGDREALYIADLHLLPLLACEPVFLRGRHKIAQEKGRVKRIVLIQGRQKSMQSHAAHRRKSVDLNPANLSQLF